MTMKKSKWILAVMASVWCLAAVRGAVAQSVDGTTGAAYNVDVQLRQEAATREGARRQELTASILAAREAASGRKFSPALRGSLAAKLARVDSTALEAFANAGGLGNIDALAPNALGDSAADLVFTAVTPCRIVNTVATSTPLAANTSRPFYVNGNAAAVFEAQGGTAGGCGIPDSATAVEMNFIAVGPAAAGDFRAFPWSAAPTPPLASVINYANVAGLNIANGLAQPVCNAATTACTFDLIVQADAGQSHLIIDVVGYYNKVNKAQVKSFSVNATSPAGALTGTCSNAGGTQLTIVAPVAGKIVARAEGYFLLNHVTGTNSIVIGGIGTTATDCPGGSDTSFARIEASWPTAATTIIPMPISRVLTVAAGSTTTLFLNAFQTSGAGHSLNRGKFEATFIPD